MYILRWCTCFNNLEMHSFSSSNVLKECEGISKFTVVSLDSLFTVVNLERKPIQSLYSDKLLLIQTRGSTLARAVHLIKRNKVIVSSLLINYTWGKRRQSCWHFFSPLSLSWKNAIMAIKFLPNLFIELQATEVLFFFPLDAFLGRKALLHNQETADNLLDLKENDEWMNSSRCEYLLQVNVSSRSAGMFIPTRLGRGKRRPVRRQLGNVLSEMKGVRFGEKSKSTVSSISNGRLSICWRTEPCKKCPGGPCCPSPWWQASPLWVMIGQTDCQ